MKSLVTSALILATLSGAALAASPVSGVNAGDVQLAYAAGVEPGRYSRAELIAIIDAQRSNETQTAQYFLSGANRASAASNTSAGAAQLALSAGVEPGQFSVPELVQLIEAKRDNDTATVNFILSGKNRVQESNGVSPGKAQLAALVGVDPAEYSLAELIALQPSNDD